MADEGEEIATEEGDADVSAMLDLTKKKKKKKPKAKTSDTSKGTTEAATVGTKSGDVDLEEQQNRLKEQDEAQELGNADDRRAEYSYDELLERVVDLLQANNPDLVEKKRTRIKPPQLQLMSSKKTMWVNYQEICSMMQRDPQHVYQFFMAELGTEGSIDGNQRLIIRGKYLGKYIESLLRKYVVEYVTCEMCRSANTDLVKNQASRLHFCNCRDCGSSRSVAVIKSGYHATSRADRRAARNAKG
jgi:translation initiation factor 2 subunit 2